MDEVLQVPVLPSVKRTAWTIIPVETKKAAKRTFRRLKKNSSAVFNEYKMPPEIPGYIRPKKHDHF